MPVIAPVEDQQASTIEITFRGPMDAAVENRLRQALEAGGYTVDVKWVGDIAIWQCDLPFGEIVTEDSVLVAMNALEESGANQYQ